MSATAFTAVETARLCLVRDGCQPSRVPHKGAVVKGLTLAELVHVYDVRRLLEVEAARQGSQRISPADVARMQNECELMRTASAEQRVIAYLDHDEALLTILYEAADNPVLVNTIKTLWEHCRAYKIVGAQASLDAPGDDSLWRYQQRLVAAARDHDGDAAAAVNTGLNDACTVRKLVAAARMGMVHRDGLLEACPGDRLTGVPGGTETARRPGGAPAPEHNEGGRVASAAA